MSAVAVPNLRRLEKRVRARLNMPVKFAAWKLGARRAPIFPDRVYIESTNHCNLKCIMCPTGLGVIQRPKGYMDMDLYRRIVDELVYLEMPEPFLAVGYWYVDFAQVDDEEVMRALDRAHARVGQTV